MIANYVCGIRINLNFLYDQFQANSLSMKAIEMWHIIIT